MRRYLWHLPEWPRFRWDSEALLSPLGRARATQGKLLAAGDSLGLEVQVEAMTDEIFTSSAIEGERLDRRSVRSSVARRLGLDEAGLPPSGRYVEGLVQMLVDATIHYDAPLGAERLGGWHAALFPTGYSGLCRIVVGTWRGSEADPMRVVSGPYGRERVHYEAPPASRLSSEMGQLFGWWSTDAEAVEGFVRAGIVHLWFVTIHPFEDGNGRIARALTELALAKDEGTGRRLYSMSARIDAERSSYYTVLERTQRGDGDITEWLVWFLGCLQAAMARSLDQVSCALRKASFWQRDVARSLNQRQAKVVNRLLDAGPDGFEGGLTNRKYRSMTKASPTTAKRDLTNLLSLGILVKNPGGGRSVSYSLVWP